MEYVPRALVSNDSNSHPPDASDEDLLAELARGRSEAAGPLYARYAPIVLGLARQAVDRGTAEEIVQEVFVAVWKGARSFDPARGSVRGWLLQIAHFRIANELRRRRRRPRTGGGGETEGDDDAVSAIPDGSAGADEATWRAYRSRALLSALDELPPPQRQALGLSFFEELSHAQIAEVLGVPIGTAKSRIRLALSRLRGRLALVSAATLAIAFAVWTGVRVQAGRGEWARDRRAIGVLTSSEAEAIRVVALETGGLPAEAHATWRAKRGEGLAVVTLSRFSPAGDGREYRVWASIRGAWVLAGRANPDGNGRAVFVVEGPAFALRPDAIEVRRAGSGSPIGREPSGERVAEWKSKSPADGPEPSAPPPPR